MRRRITIEIDRLLIERAKEGLGNVNEALCCFTLSMESERARRAVRQSRYLESLGSRADLRLLASAEMWR